MAGGRGRSRIGAVGRRAIGIARWCLRDETNAALPGVSVELRPTTGLPSLTITDANGAYRFQRVAAGRYALVFSLLNLATVRRDLSIGDSASRVDVVLHLALNAAVTVIGKRMFTNLADVEHPEQDLVGIAQAASQRAITSRPCA